MENSIIGSFSRWRRKYWLRPSFPTYKKGDKPLSLYADYLKERTNDQIIEVDFGFVSYRHLPEEKSTYIIDIYVSPDFRKEGLAAKLADQVADEARTLGHLKLLGSVVPSNKGSTTSLKVLLGYGMFLKSSTNDFIVFEKGL